MLAEYQVELKYEILDNFEEELFADKHGIKAALAKAKMFDDEGGTIKNFSQSSKIFPDEKIRF